MGQPFMIQLENRPGELAHVTRALAMRGINIETIAGSGAGDKMCAMLTTDDNTMTREVLHSMGIPFVEGDSLFVEVVDRPGGIAELTEKLSSGGRQHYRDPHGGPTGILRPAGVEGRRRGPRQGSPRSAPIHTLVETR